MPNKARGTNDKPKMTSDARRPKARMTGSVAANFHEAGRSELLADFLFSAWGTTTPTRRQDDTGTDLSCTLTETVGRRGIVTDYYVVQVKSALKPWVFPMKQAVEWIVDYPSPIFLTCVEKKSSTLRIYHLNSRFVAGFELKHQLVLTPEVCREGQPVMWSGDGTFSLSAPILEVTTTDIANKQRMDALRSIFRRWVRIDRENCDLRRMGLLRYRMPGKYLVNEDPSGSIVEMGWTLPDAETLARLVLNAAEFAEGLGGQIARRGDQTGALFAALFVDHLYRCNLELFQNVPRWRSGSLTGDLGKIVLLWLDAARPNVSYVSENFDNLSREIRALVSRLHPSEPKSRLS